MKQRWVILILCLTFFMSGCRSKEVKTSQNPNQEIGSETVDLKIEDHAIISIGYPKTGYDKLDQEIKQTVQIQKQQFMQKVKSYNEADRKAELNINYESYIKDERYISIKLMIFESIYKNQEIVETIHYDIEHDAFFDLDDIFQEDFIPFVSKSAKQYFQSQFPQECEGNQFRIGITPIKTHYEEFILTKDKMVFYFNPGDIFDNSASFNLSFDKIAPFSELEKEESTVFVPYEDVLNEPVRVIDPNQPMVALTFDDGPTKRYTEAILDALKEHNSVATFFILGSRAANAPALLQRMVMEGSEIGNHTYSHKQLTTLSKERIEEEISQTQETIHNITNRYPEVIRPPYGSKNETVLSCAHNQRIVTWTLDTEDWRSRNSRTIVNRVLNTVKDKDIILMHDLYASSANAAIKLIDELNERGYQLVSVSELYHYSSSHQYPGT